MSFRSTQDRKKSFKTGLSVEEQRSKRNESNVKIRKKKQEESLLKKRNLVGDLSPDKKGDFNASRLEHLPAMVQGVNSDDPALQLDTTTQFRKLLSIERNPPIEQVIAAGVVPRFVHFLRSYDYPQLQFEAAWALTNVASGSSDQTRFVIDAQAVPVLIELLASPNDEVREQAVWALGNIAGDSPQCRDYVLQYGAMTPLLNNLKETSKLSMLRNATWTLSNFCRGKPQPPFDLVKIALPTLARLIYSTDEEVLTDACWALSYLSDGPNDRIQVVLEVGIARRMAELLLHSSYSVQTPALRTIGNIVTGDDNQTQIILNVGALACLASLLQSPKKGIRKEACWTISNITAGNKSQIQAIIDAGLIKPLVDLLETAEFDIRKEAAWALSNATSGGSPQQIRYLVQCGCIKPLCDMLTLNDPRIILVALEGLENILKVGPPDVQEYCIAIEAVEGIDKIENLHSNPNTEIFQKALSIIETYFSDDQETKAIVPEAEPMSFTFGTSAPSQGFQF